MFRLLAIFFEPLFRLIAGGAAVYVIYDMMTTIVMPLFSQLSSQVLTDSANASWASSFPIVYQFFEFFEVTRHVSLIVSCVMAGAVLKVSVAAIKAFSNSMKGVSNNA